MHERAKRFGAAIMVLLTATQQAIQAIRTRSIRTDDEMTTGPERDPGMPLPVSLEDDGPEERNRPMDDRLLITMVKRVRRDHAPQEHLRPKTRLDPALLVA